MTDVDDIEGLARNITRILSNPDEAERLRQRGYARAASFSWEKTARRYLEVYEQTQSLPLKLPLLYSLISGSSPPSKR